MAIVINASLSKKVPIVGMEFSSRQASITISGEVADISHVGDQAKRLFAAAESAVDAQLGMVPSPQAATPPSSPQYPSTNKRAPAPISAAQLRYLNQLLDRQPGAVNQILSDNKVATVEHLTSRQASTIIERLKGVSA